MMSRPARPCISSTKSWRRTGNSAVTRRSDLPHRLREGRTSRPALRLWALATFLLSASSSVAFGGPVPFPPSLAQDPQWLALLHYGVPVTGGVARSLVDDPAFFLSPAGGTDPQAELAATLAAFRSPVPDDPNQAPACLWPARYAWLDEQLHLGGPVPCPALQDWLANIDPGRLALVFPAAYLNNPASMFGHTLLRVDPRRAEATPLTSYAISYGAETGQDGGFAFAWKGLTGGYRGYVSLQPYYLTVRTYNDIESRDIWEYDLALSPTRSCAWCNTSGSCAAVGRTIISLRPTVPSCCCRCSTWPGRR